MLAEWTNIKTFYSPHSCCVFFKDQDPKDKGIDGIVFSIKNIKGKLVSISLTLIL